MDPKWYLKRLASMSPDEVIGRVQDEARRRLWSRRPPDRPERAPVGVGVDPGRAAPVVPDELTAAVSAATRSGLLAEADGLLDGRWTMFGRERTDMSADVDWFLDFVNRVRAPDDRYSLSINHRDESAVGNIKFVWEPARHQHLTILAAAYAVSGDQRYAQRVDRELHSYWRANPFLVGIHWTSGIELGLRLISWTWIRRLLDGWSGASSLFEESPAFVEQLGRHHQWLDALSSHGTSANNHAIAEAAGQFIAAAAFPLFAKSEAWREAAAEELARELAAQTFPDGLNRELASDYHGFVLEMALAAYVEAVLVDHPVAEELVDPIARALDALHAVVDVTGHPHRQGDSDDAHGWLVDPIEYHRWASLLRTAPVVVEPAPWWVEPSPAVGEGGGDDGCSADVRTALIRRCLADRGPATPPTRRPDTRPSLFPDAGLTVLRTGPPSDPGTDGEELWCAFDHGPHGFLATAAHAHADALAIEIRAGGVEIVADPGTYCYHGEPEWRDHFRSTAAHATVELGGVDQSEMAGPFLWTRKAETVLEAHQGLDGADPIALCRARHDGYARFGLVHRREVRLDRERRTISVVDSFGRDSSSPAAGVAGAGSGGLETPLQERVPVVKSFPLGPSVEVELDADGSTAHLRWAGGSGWATVNLDTDLSWSIACGSTSPLAGWYSARFGTKHPAAVLVGRSPAAEPGADYTTTIQFRPRQQVAD